MNFCCLNPDPSPPPSPFFPCNMACTGSRRTFGGLSSQRNRPPVHQLWALGQPFPPFHRERRSEPLSFPFQAAPRRLTPSTKATTHVFWSSSATPRIGKRPRMRPRCQCLVNICSHSLNDFEFTSFVPGFDSQVGAKRVACTGQPCVSIAGHFAERVRGLTKCSMASTGRAYFDPLISDLFACS